MTDQPQTVAASAPEQRTIDAAVALGPSLTSPQVPSTVMRVVRAALEMRRAREEAHRRNVPMRNDPYDELCASLDALVVLGSERLLTDRSSEGISHV